MPFPEYEDRRATAYHECGHAWLNALIGLPMRKIHMWWAFFNAYGGEVTFDLAHDEGFRAEDVEMLILSFLAGQEAESLWLVSQFGVSLGAARDETKPGARKDLCQVRALLRLNMSPSEKECRLSVDKVLHAHWPALALLAEKLYDNKSLRPREVEREADGESTKGLDIQKIVLVTPQTPVGAT